MTAVVVPFAPAQRMASPRSWQPGEIAEVYRVIDLLGRAGLPVLMESGRSDEGDPWLVVMREDTQEVIVHIARIDGRIVAVSVANDRVFTGVTLESALQSVLGTQPLVLPSGGTRLFLHPATILAAFVATALAHSDGGIGETAAADPQHAVAMGLDTGPRNHVEGLGLTHRSAEGSNYSLSMVAAAVAVIATTIALTSDGVQPNSFSDPLQLLATLPQTPLKAVEYAQQMPTDTGSGAETAFDMAAHAMLGDLQVAGAAGLDEEQDREQIQIAITLAPEGHEQITPSAAFDDGQVRVAPTLPLTGVINMPQSLAYELTDGGSLTDRALSCTPVSASEMSELAFPSTTPICDTPGAFSQPLAIITDRQAYSSLEAEAAARASMAASTERSIVHVGSAQSVASVDKGGVADVPSRLPVALATSPHQGSTSSMPSNELTTVHFNNGEVFYWQGVSLLGLLDDQGNSFEHLKSDELIVPSMYAETSLDLITTTTLVVADESSAASSMNTNISLNSIASATFAGADVSGEAQIGVSAVDPVTDGDRAQVAAPAVVVEPMMIKVPLGVSAEAKARVLTEFAHSEVYELQVASRVERQLSLIIDANPYLSAVDRVIVFEAPSIKTDMFMLMPGIAMVRSGLIPGNTDHATTATPQAEFTLMDGTTLRLLGVLDI